MVSNSAHAIAQLAQLRDPSKRQQLALGVTEMCLAQQLSPTAEPVAGELLITLSSAIDTKTKIAMVEKLSASDWAPHSAIRHFAFDQIEVACIVIRNSSLLSEQDMIALAQTGSPEHRAPSGQPAQPRSFRDRCSGQTRRSGHSARPRQ